MNSTADYYVCEFCDKQFKRKGNFNNHSKTHIKDEAHTKVYDTTSAETKDVKLPSRDSNDEHSKFQVCSMTFSTKGNIQRQSKLLPERKIYNCKDCRKYGVIQKVKKLNIGDFVR
ncbi:c2H2-type domain-containing protein [Trichonephila clavipes]|nr:c2H2-type domain-containing protein [Trichonephila clavipes]